MARPILDARSIAAGLALLTREQERELAHITVTITDALEFLAETTAYLLEHVGIEEIQRALRLGYGAEQVRRAELMLGNGDVH